MNFLSVSAPCPCGRLDARGRPLAYADCCGPFIEGRALAPDAHALMRSRYSAFVLERLDYLLSTWHASTRPDTLEFDAGVKWLGLAVRDVVPPTAAQPNHAQVEFVARYRLPGGAAVRLHERSHFICEAGAWLYVEGVQRA